MYSVYYTLLYMGDLNRSFSRLQSFDLDGLDDVVGSLANWLDDKKKTLKTEHEHHLTAEKFGGPNKPVLARWLAEARDIMCKQRDMMDNMKEMIELLKTEALGDKEKVIRLQGELLERKDEQLKSLQSTVEETVQSTVQTEIRCYSDAVKKGSGGTVYSKETLKSVMKSVAAEDERSRNVMVFGLGEEDGEQLSTLVTEVFGELDEKPRFEASRVGRRESTTATRPVKITLQTSTAAQQILMKARRLKLVEKLKSVYICPDRSSDERVARRLVVTDLKKVSAEQPHRRHYIRSGKVCSMDREAT